MNNFPSIGMPVLDPNEKYQDGVVDKLDQILTGQTFSESSYPALYAELGTNVIAAMDSGDPSCPWRIVADLTEAVSIVDSADPFGDGSLLAKYQLDGSPADTTGNYDGVVVDNAYVEGLFDDGSLYNGSSGYIETGNLPDYRSGFAISGFVQLDATPGYKFLVVQRSSGGYTHISIRFRDNKLEVLTGNGTSAYYINWTDTVVRSSGWHSYVVTGTASSMNVYIDGSFVINLSGTPFTNSPDMRHLLGVNHYNGAIHHDGETYVADQVEFYSRPLTQYEASSLYTQTIKVPAGA